MMTNCTASPTSGMAYKINAVLVTHAMPEENHAEATSRTGAMEVGSKVDKRMRPIDRSRAGTPINRTA